MRFTEQEEKCIASLEKDASIHRLRWWCFLAFTPLLLFVIVYGQKTLDSFQPSENSTDYFDWHFYIMAAIYWWPAILFHCGVLGAVIGYLIVRWRPDPARVLLVKIAKELNEKQDEEQDTSAPDGTD